MESDTLQNAHLCAAIERCLQLLRSLKSTVLNAHTTLAGKPMLHIPPVATLSSSDTQTASETTPNWEKVRESIEKFAKQISNEYEKLENEARALPAQTPNSLMVNKLNQFLLDFATNPQQLEGTYQSTRSVFDWSDSTANFINFTHDLFKISNITTLIQQRNKKLTLAHQWIAQNEPLAMQHIRADPSSQHGKFVELFVQYLKQHQLVKIPDQPFEYKISYQFVERSVLSSIIEVKYLALPKGRTSDGQPVCMQKFLMLVNNGIIEYVHFAAPHEDWHYEEVPGMGNKKFVDLGTQSRFELYQKLTIYGNVIINMLSNQPTNVKMLHIFLQQLCRLLIIDMSCSRCRKRLRDFTPVIDHLTKMPTHMACK